MIKLIDILKEVAKLDAKQFEDKSKAIWGDRFDYSLVDYKNNKTPVKLICNKHREAQKEATGHEYFEQIPMHNLQGTEGCPQHRKEENKNTPQGETALLKVLNDLGYEEGKDFKIQYPYPGLTGEASKRKLTADVYLPGLNTIIEFDGELHFKPGNYSDSQEKFRKQVMYDKLKNAYCKENGVSLIRIPYSMKRSNQLTDLVRDAIEKIKPGEMILLGDYPKKGWNAEA